MELTEKTKTAVKTLNGFDLSFDGVLSQDWGDLVPIVCKEMVPGDSFTCDASAFVRLAPLASPTYGRIHGYINYFFVPSRILMEEGKWEKNIDGGTDGMYPERFPFITTGEVSAIVGYLTDPDASVTEHRRGRDVRKLFTYLGLPDPKNYDQRVPFKLSMLPFAAYNRIYGDYYFAWGYENDAAVEALYFYKLKEGGNGSHFDPYNDYFAVKHACFKKDYLTTAQIRPQRGPEVFTGVTDDPIGYTVTGVDNSESDSTGSTYSFSYYLHKYADALQKYLVRNNIAGGRYFEKMLARFGVKLQAERLQRSEYLGGKDFWINVSDVTSTAETESANLGDLAGKGVGLGQCGVSYNAEEHGFFIAILHLMPESGIVQSIDRMWTRWSRFDYFTPEFEDTGMQPIYNSEVYGDPFVNSDAVMEASVPSDTGVFGYIPRYADYKFSRPLLAGDFKIANVDPLFLGDMDSMHLYRLFSTEWDFPILSHEWLICDGARSGAFNRIFQDTNDDFDHFWTNIQVSLGAKRPMLGYAEASTGFMKDDKGRLVSMPLFGERL